MPVRFDNTTSPGHLDTIGYLDLNKITPEELAKIVLEKIKAKKASYDFKHELVDDNSALLFSEDLLTIQCGEKYVVFNLAHYKFLIQIMDDLYINYMTEMVRPFTYGKEWLLTSYRPTNQLIVPIEWVNNKYKPTHEINPNWSLELLISEVGMVAGNRLRVNFGELPDGRNKIYGISTNNYKIIQILNSNPKGIGFFRANFDALSEISINQLNSYKYHLVYFDWLHMINSNFLVENNNPISPELLQNLLDLLKY